MVYHNGTVTHFGFFFQFSSFLKKDSKNIKLWVHFFLQNLQREEKNSKISQFHSPLLSRSLLVFFLFQEVSLKRKRFFIFLFPEGDLSRKFFREQPFVFLFYVLFCWWRGIHSVLWKKKRKKKRKERVELSSFGWKPKTLTTELYPQSFLAESFHLSFQAQKDSNPYLRFWKPTLYLWAMHSFFEWRRIWTSNFLFVRQMLYRWAIHPRKKILMILFEKNQRRIHLSAWHPGLDNCVQV